MEETNHLKKTLLLWRQVVRMKLGSNIELMHAARTESSIRNFRMTIMRGFYQGDENTAVKMEIM